MSLRLLRGLVLTAAVSFPVLVAAPVEARNLVLAIGGEPEENFDPVKGWGDYGHPLFQSTLLKLDPDLKIVGDLATAWKLDDTGTVWDITIRADARFADGRPVTAEDVAFTFETAKTAGGRADVTLVTATKVLAPDRLQIVLSRPQITFTRQMMALGILPKHAYGPDYGEKPMGSGPFRFVEWKKGQQLIVEPNPFWHGGKVAFERMTFLFTGEDTSFAAAMAGTVQVVAVPPSLGSRAVPAMKVRAFDTVDNRGLMFPTVPDTGQKTAEGAPIGNSVTADIAIRKAVNMAIDREALVLLALDGRGKPARGPVDGLPWDNPDAAVKSPNVAGAKALLDAAGWRPGVDGVRVKNGLRASFRIVYNAKDSTRQALAVGVTDQLKALGIEALPTGRSWAEIKPGLMHSNVIVFGWGAHDPLEIYMLYHSRFRGEGWYNPAFYSNMRVDAYMDEAQKQTTIEASLPFWQKAQWDGSTGFGSKGDAVWAWMVNLQHVYFVHDCLDVGRPQVHPHGHGFPITHAVETWRWTCPN
jgi:peptide/nickel transport system substrate-binding protein